MCDENRWIVIPSRSLFNAMRGDPQVIAENKRMLALGNVTDETGKAFSAPRKGILRTFRRVELIDVQS